MFDRTGTLDHQSNVVKISPVLQAVSTSCARTVPERGRDWPGWTRVPLLALYI